MILLIGDIQGCCGALDELLAKAGFSPSRDRLVALGDLVNRGPQSLQVLQRLRALGNAATCLLGNHDLHLLAAAQGVRKLHRSDTLDDILASPEREAWIDWVRQRPLAVQESGWLCVHAGVPPQWDAGHTLSLADEVQQMLRGPHLEGFLQGMYGNEPSSWNEGLAGADRWRFVINALTRMRFCDAQGMIDFKTKGDADSAQPGFVPWFEHPQRRTQGTPIAFGHWSTLGLMNRPDLLGLDTGCVWGGALTAVRVDEGRREVLQVPCAQSQQPGH